MREAKDGEKAVRRLLLLVWEIHTEAGSGDGMLVLVFGSAGLVTQERQVVAVLLTQPSP